jgi:hypothetical protein
MSRWAPLALAAALVALSLTGGVDQARAASQTCPLTIPSAKLPGGFNVGSTRLGVALPPFGVYVAVPDVRPGWAWAQNDGLIRAKVGWSRERGPLRVVGRRLDRSAPPLRADIGPEASYPGSFSPSRLYFPTPGCWKLTARAGGTTLGLVVLIVRA